MRPLSGRRLLALFAHPDDESYAAGALLARCASGGARVIVLCATRGEAGVDRRGEARPGPDLARVRSMELARSCAMLGIEPPRYLGLADGGGRRWDIAAAAEAVRLEILRWRPHVLLTHGEDGAYGHVDHRACARIATRVAAGLPPASSPPRLLQVAFPTGLFEPVRRALRRLMPGCIDDGDFPLGVASEAVDLRIDVSGEARERKLASVAAHASQLDDGDPMTFLRPGLLQGLLHQEWFTVASGPPLPPGATDPFAGLPR